MWQKIYAGLNGIGTSVGGRPSRFCARDGLTQQHHLAEGREET